MAGTKKNLLVKFLLHREHGTLALNERCISGTNNSQAIAEEKSTIPVINKACELSGHSRSTFLVSFSPDRTKIASTHGDHTVRVTEMLTGKCTHILRGHPRTPWSIAFHPASNDILATGCLGGEVRIWDLRGGGSEIWKSEQGRVIASLAFHPTDQVLVIATNNELLFWDWSKSEPFARCKTASDYEKVRWCKFDPFGHYLYTGIANKSTIQSDELDGVGLVDLGPETAEDDRRLINEQYRNVLNEISRWQRDRASASSDGLMNELDLVEPQSPTQLDSIRDARQYAEHVTRTNLNLRQRQLENARQYAASVSRSNNSNNGSMPRIEIGRVEGPSAPDINDTDDHMQQIHRIPNVYAPRSNSSQGLETLAQAAAAVSQMETAYSSPPMLSGSPRRRDINGNQLSFTQPRNVTASSQESNNSSQRIHSYARPFDFSEEISAIMRSLPGEGTSSPSTTSFSGQNSNQSEQNNGVNNGTRLSTGAIIGPYDLSNSSSTESAESQDLSVVPHDSIEIAAETDLTRDVPASNEGINGQSSSSATEINNSENPLRGGSNAWQTFEGGSLNIEIPNMTPNSDDSNSLSGPLRTPRNSTDVDRPAQLPGVALTQPLNNLSDNMSPSSGNFEYTSRSNLLATNSSGMTNRTFDPVNRSLYTQQRSLARSGNFLFSSGSSRSSDSRSSLFDTYSNSVANRTSSVVNISTTANTVRASGLSSSIPSPSISRLSTSSTVLTSSNSRASSPGMSFFNNGQRNLERLGIDMNSLGYNRRLITTPPTTSENNTAGESATTPRRGRNLLRLLETPFVRTSTSGAVNESDTPAPVPPVTQTPLFQTQNRVFHTSQSRTSDHNYFSSSRPISRSTGFGSRRSHRLSDTCPDNCQICGNGSMSSSNDITRRRRPRRHLPRTSYTSLASSLTSTTSGNTESSGRSNIHISSPNVNANTRPSASSLSPSRQPQRLATIIESEVRDAINRIRSRRLNISETIRDLNHLQRDLADIPMTDADGASTGASSSEVPEAPGSSSNQQETNLNDVTGQSNETNVQITNVNQGASPEEAVEGNSSEAPVSEAPAAEVEIRVEMDNGSSSDHSSDGLQNTAGSMNSNDIDESLERLDQRVSFIRRRLRERMHAMRNTNQSVSNRMNGPNSAAQRMHDRRQRMQRHLEELHRRRRERHNIFRRFTTNLNSRGPTENVEFTENEDDIHRTSRLRNLQNEIQNVRVELARHRERERRRWHVLHRRHLHPDYSHSIIDETRENRESDFQAAINRTIAGHFMANGEASIASNIVNLTHRVQRWDFSSAQIPVISDPTVNVVIPCCKLHNDATAEISQDGKLLAMFVPSHRGFPDDTVLGVFSLESHNLGKCLFTKSFGPNAISVSISPLNNYVLVGLASKRLQWVFAPKQMVAQIYKLKQEEAGEDSMEHICDLMHPCDLDLRVHVSVNSARWLPGVGEGVVYCTNRGDLHICKPGWEKNSTPLSTDNPEDRQQVYTRQLVMQLLRINSPRTNNSATQTTTQGVRRSASTQTDQVAVSNDTDSD